MNKYVFLLAALCISMSLLSASCSKSGNQKSVVQAVQNRQSSQAEKYGTEQDIAMDLDDFAAQILKDADIPLEISQNILKTIAEGPAFILDLLAVLEGDPYMRVLVDKKHALPTNYEPDDLVELTGGSYVANRKGLLLRRPAVLALEEMATAARAEGITLIASSTYRPYSYQQEVYARNVRQSGQETADRESARPGHSQHQLGLVIDFGSIDDSFANTKPGRWILANASKFGWSLSFPDGYEAVTGYRWESWHYRYVGRELAYFIDTYFNGIQQYALQFIYAWEKTEW